MSELIGDVERGAELFRQRCAECHAIEPGKRIEGTKAPPLFGLYGKPDKSFVFNEKTKRMTRQPFKWNDEMLDKYLRNPELVRPGVDKIFEPVTKEQDRKDLIAYLKGMSKNQL